MGLIQLLCLTFTASCNEGSLRELPLNDTQFTASSVYSHDTDDDYVKREYAPPNARLNNEINGGKDFSFFKEKQPRISGHVLAP